MLFFQLFQQLVDKKAVVKVELKNDISITGVLQSVDQYLNVKLSGVTIDNPEKYPHLVSLKNCFIRGSVVRYINMDSQNVNVEKLEDDCRRDAKNERNARKAGLIRRMGQSDSIDLLLRLIDNRAVLERLCLFRPSLTLKLQRVNSAIARALPDQTISVILTKTFEDLGLYHANPFTLCRANETESSWLMLLHGIDPGLVDQNGDTFLQIAVRSGNLTLARMLIERGCSVLGKGAFGYTPLHQVAYSCNGEMCAVLLSHGANLDALSKNGSTPLLIAAREGHIPVVEVMLRVGADPNDGGDKGLTPLLLASAEGHAEIVMLLLEFGATANELMFGNRTILHEAVESGHAEVCRVLIEVGGADCRSADIEGSTPLSIATLLDLPDLVSVLSNSVRFQSPILHARTPDLALPSIAFAKNSSNHTSHSRGLPPMVAFIN